MELDLFQVDAFTDRPFAGNPAAVVPLSTWLSDDEMAAIAAENNLSETAFIVPEGDGWMLRWFTPAAEVVLCGHATLATAHVIFTELGFSRPEVRFETRRAGPLTVVRDGDGYAMNFPSQPAKEAPIPAALSDALGAQPESLWVDYKWMAVFGDEAAVLGLKPDMRALAALDCEGVIATAPGAPRDGGLRPVDFVSRFFGPKVGVPEDPVTGSAHCVLTPYWDARLRRRGALMTACQVSARGGDLGCRLDGDRVVLSGRAVTVIRGKLRF